jgi:hypothetical protein
LGIWSLPLAASERKVRDFKYVWLYFPVMMRQKIYFPCIFIFGFAVIVIIKLNGRDIKLDQAPEKPVDVRKGFEEVCQVLMEIEILVFPINP